MTKLGEKDWKAQRRKAFKLTLDDDHLIAIGQVALRAGMLDNLIDLTAEQLIQRHSPIKRKELGKFTRPRKLDLIKEALTQEMPESSNAISEFFDEIHSARSESNEIVHRSWPATDTPEVKALVKVKHKEPEEHYAASRPKGWLPSPKSFWILQSNLVTGRWLPTTRSFADPHRPPCRQRPSGL